MSGAHAGFELVREQSISELDTGARLFRHRRTGAEVLSLTNRDENKSFAITFRTLPSDDTGVAHILEHSVLSGSGKYPVKELFMELLKGSCATFINAMTFPDKTCYPVASTNLKDFYNLVDVYFDVVLNPLLESHTLDQEGWHFELEGPDAALSYKGVVFNEMKGAYSLQDAHIAEQVTRALLPNTIYAHSSGGDPQHIPELSHARWREFHRRFYHPSNARICFWGDDPEETRLRIVDEALKPFDRQPVSETIALQSRFTAPHRSSGRVPAPVAVSLSALLVFPIAFLRSFAYAGIPVVALAVIGAVVLLPAGLAVLGDRINKFSLPHRKRERLVVEGTFWWRVATAVMRRPVPVAAVSIAVLLVLGIPSCGSCSVCPTTACSRPRPRCGR